MWVKNLNQGQKLFHKIYGECVFQYVSKNPPIGFLGVTVVIDGKPVNKLVNPNLLSNKPWDEVAIQKHEQEKNDQLSRNKRSGTPLFTEGTTIVVYQKKCRKEGKVLEDCYANENLRVLYYGESTPRTISKKSLSNVVKIVRRPENYPSLTVGQHVCSWIDGVDGRVVEVGDDWCVVSIGEKTTIIPLGEIRVLDDDLIGDDEIEEENYETGFKVIPSNFSDKRVANPYPDAAISFLKWARKSFTEGFACTQNFENRGVVKSLTGSVLEKEKSVKGVIVVPDKGAIVFNIVTNITVDILLSYIGEKLIQGIHERFLDTYREKFYKSTRLCGYSGNFKCFSYPIRFVTVIPEIDLNELSRSQLAGMENIKKLDFLLFKNGSNLRGDSLFSHFEPHDRGFSVIPQSEYPQFIERIAPEYITMTEMNKVGECRKDASYGGCAVWKPVIGKEYSIKSICLTDDQIKAVNDTATGPSLTLANPGTGKSAILLAKAYHYINLNTRLDSTCDVNVLITCYNANLADRHELARESNGIDGKHIKICTFHSLVISLLEYFGEMSTAKSLRGTFDNKSYDDDFERAVKKVIDRINHPRMNEYGGTTRFNNYFKMILIDEVQLFKPAWLELCRKILGPGEDTECYFQMYGDLNQDVRAAKYRGRAPWQEAGIHIRNIKKLDINYRNSDKIGAYLNYMLEDHEEFLSLHGIQRDKDLAVVSSECVNKKKLKVHIATVGSESKTKMSKTVVTTIEELRHSDGRDVDYSDIAVLYPMSHFNPAEYAVLEDLRRELCKHNIPFDQIHGDSGARTDIGKCQGVILSTIDSSLGLDFKYVIICGLHSYDFVNINPDDQRPKWEKATSRAQLNELAYKRINEYCKKIYTAASRARDGLFIVDDCISWSLVKGFIRPSQGKGEVYEYK